ncbi:hypothetical protein BJV78DRAFT_1097762, partial [Lactifluus subvellereus]
RSPRPLCMILYGKGGTGKSRVIQDYGRISAYTGGVAAALIGGKTAHTVAMLSTCCRGRVSDDTKAKLQSFWKDTRYIIVDEFSMISKTLL